MKFFLIGIERSLPKHSKTYYFISILTIFNHKKRHKNKLFKNLIQYQLFNKKKTYKKFHNHIKKIIWYRKFV